MRRASRSAQSLLAILERKIAPEHSAASASRATAYLLAQFLNSSEAPHPRYVFRKSIGSHPDTHATESVTAQEHPRLDFGRDPGSSHLSDEQMVALHDRARSLKFWNERNAASDTRRCIDEGETPWPQIRILRHRTLAMRVEAVSRSRICFR